MPTPSLKGVFDFSSVFDTLGVEELVLKLRGTGHWEEDKLLVP